MDLLPSILLLLLADKALGALPNSFDPAVSLEDRLKKCHYPHLIDEKACCSNGRKRQRSFLALQFSTFLKCGNTLQYFMGLGEEEEDER